MPAFSFTAPVFTKEDEDREKAELTVEEREKLLDDLYGRNEDELSVCGSEQEEEQDQSDVTDEQLIEMEAALQEIPCHQKEAYEQAMATCPEIVTSESSAARFLRREEHNPTRAAQRLVRYWKMRRLVFEDRAFLPMTLGQALAGERQDIMAHPNFLRIIPPDRKGRTVLFGDRSEFDPNAFSSRLSLVRIIWYVMHIALEKASTQKKGVVLLIVPIQRFNLNAFDRCRRKLVFLSYSQCLPLQIRAVHWCYPGPMFKYLAPAVKFLASRKGRLRSQYHDGTKQEVLEALKKYGLKQEGLPAVLGGEYPVHRCWVRERRIIEESLASPYTRLILHSLI